MADDVLIVGCMSKGTSGQSISNNTLVGGGVLCDETGSLPTYYSGNIFYNTSVSSSQEVSDPQCSYKNNLSNTMLLPKGMFDNTNTNIMADPMFVDAAHNDFHLQAGSPAIDKITGVDVDHDHDGTKRPQGPASDIGAFEYVPPPAN